MNLKKHYETLYNQWLKEFESPELTPLSEKNFILYKEMIASFNNVDSQKETNLQSELLHAYKNNVKFLLDDLLKMRELKLINTAFALVEVNIENLIEPEKLLYQNLVATIKGYKKVKALTIENEKYNIIQETELKSNEKPSESLISNNKPIYQSEKELYKEPKKEIMQKTLEEEKSLQYTLIRFIKSAPCLVGVDLKNYGPFEENDVANIPSQNAIILLNENYAEKIDIS